jgi:serine/threonine protein kinase
LGFAAKPWLGKRLMGVDEFESRARARLGSVLKGKYRLDRVLGVGGMAAVYAATHLRNTNRVAVKVLHREVALDAGLRERFLREGYAANSVAHPGTVRILDDDTAEDGAVFLVMELLDGETLEARWVRKSGHLPAEEVAVLTYQLLDVLAAAHAKGIVHRDVKPENLFLTRERVLKVLDFGVARLLEGSAATTRAGSVLGTPAFMAPEQVLGKTREVDAQSDVWAIGATAFTLLSGRYVHEAETPEEMMVFTASRTARSLATVAPEVPEPLIAVVDRALALDKAKRWASARSMQKAMAHAYQSAFGAPLPGTRASDDEEIEASDDKTTVIPEVPEVEADKVPTLSDKTSPVVKVPGGDRPATEQPESAPAPLAAFGGTLPVHQSTVAGVTGPSTGSYKVPRKLVLVAVGAVGLIAGIVIVARIMGGHEPSPAPSGGTVASGVTALPPPAVSSSVAAAIATIEPPSVHLAAMPSATPAPAAPERLAPPRPAPAPLPPPPAAIAPLPVAAPSPPPTAAPPSKQGCTPPYTVDAKTDKKKWKVECL